MKRYGNWMIRVLVILSAMLWLGVVAASWSEAAEGSTNNSNGVDEEYNFSWLDPDKKIYVLQNRKYTKAGRAMLTLNGGLANTSAYRTSYSVDPRVGYYFTENWGLEVFYSFFTNKPNNTAKALQSTSSTGGARPDVLEVKTQMGALLHWSPWYAKINVFNSIIYFDWYFTGGLGAVNVDAIPGSVSQTSNLRTVSKNYTGIYLGTGHQFHLSKNFLLRLDVTNVWFKAPQRAVTGPETYFNSTTFEAGFGFRL